MIITVIPMASTRADWSRLTAWLVDCEKTQVTISWIELGKIVGGLPDSATKHYPQWWSGDRPITRAWHRAGYERLSLDPVARTLTLRRSTAYGNLEKASVVTSTGITRAPKAHRQEQLGSVIDLKSIDPRSTLIVLPRALEARRSVGQVRLEVCCQRGPMKCNAHVLDCERKFR